MIELIETSYLLKLKQLNVGDKFINFMTSYYFNDNISSGDSPPNPQGRELGNSTRRGAFAKAAI